VKSFSVFYVPEANKNPVDRDLRGFLLVGGVIARIAKGCLYEKHATLYRHPLKLYTVKIKS
jgi:hypothetical protein